MSPSSPLRRRLCYAFANMDATNKLYFGDNLKILREYVPDASVDFVYLDPAFNSSATYDLLFKQQLDAADSAFQIPRIMSFGTFAASEIGAASQRSRDVGQHCMSVARHQWSIL